MCKGAGNRQKNVGTERRTLEQKDGGGNRKKDVGTERRMLEQIERCR